MKKKSKPKQSGAPAWMATYGDMVTLLLCFFVLMLSYANMDEMKFGAAAVSLQGALGVIGSSGSSTPTSHSINNSTGQNNVFDRLNQLQDAIVELEMEDVIEVEFNQNGTTLRLDDQILFSSGKANLKPAALEVFKTLTEILKSKTNDILVSGHTDNIPINNDDFQSNWDLSVARALSVVKALIELGISENALGAVGYGEFRPIESNDTVEGRQKNRRVEFLVSWN